MMDLLSKIKRFMCDNGYHPDMIIELCCDEIAFNIEQFGITILYDRDSDTVTRDHLRDEAMFGDKIEQLTQLIRENREILKDW